jgi:hypothetical protein
LSGHGITACSMCRGPLGEAKGSQTRRRQQVRRAPSSSRSAPGSPLAHWRRRTRSDACSCGHAHTRAQGAATCTRTQCGCSRPWRMCRCAPPPSPQPTPLARALPRAPRGFSEPLLHAASCWCAPPPSTNPNPNAIRLSCFGAGTRFTGRALAPRSTAAPSATKPRRRATTVWTPPRCQCRAGHGAPDRGELPCWCGSGGGPAPNVASAPFPPCCPVPARWRWALLCARGAR